MKDQLKQTDYEKLKLLLDAQPKKKAKVKQILAFDRPKMSRLLNGKRRLEFSEGIAVANILDLSPDELLK